MREPHPLEGAKVVLNDRTTPGVREINPKPGDIFVVGGWIGEGRLTLPDGGTWVSNAKSNFACAWYAARVVKSEGRLPGPESEGWNDVLYGHIDNIGHIVHVSEIGELVV